MWEQRGFCKANIHTKGAEIVKRTNVHLQAPHGRTAICCEVKTRIKRKAINSQDSSHQIVGESPQTISEGVAAKLTKLDSLKRSIQHQRVRHPAALVQPATSTLEHLNLQEEYKKTSKGEQLILYDSGSGTQRILIFGTQRNLEMLKLSICGFKIFFKH